MHLERTFALVEREPQSDADRVLMLVEAEEDAQAIAFELCSNGHRVDVRRVIDDRRSEASTARRAAS